MVMGKDGGSTGMKTRHTIATDTDEKDTVEQHQLNGQTSWLMLVRKQKRKKRFFRLSNVLRLAVWLFIFTTFYCPSSSDSLTYDSPETCKAYHKVIDLAAPIVQPYFDLYAAPYIQPVRPYYNMIEKHAVIPITKIGKQYGIPIAKKLKKQSRTYWQKLFSPHYERYRLVINQQYNQRLEPYASCIYKTITPYYQTTTIKALKIYSGIILPNYSAVKPRIINGGILARDIATNTVYPSLKWTYRNGKIFLIETVRPKLGAFYRESIEPQLKKIWQRLGRYRDGRSIKSTLIDTKSVLRSSTSKNLPSTSFITSESSYSTPTLETTDSVLSQSSSAEELGIREKAAKIVSRDLKHWQERFSQAADEAADELEDRITGITDKFILNQIENLGEARISELEETISVSLENLKINIISIVKDSLDIKESRERIVFATRKVGMDIKDKAENIRTWKQSQDQLLVRTITKAITDTLAILDTIRDTGLNEVGMRWAWTDGITYKDWIKYHTVKSNFAQWRQDVEINAAKHPGLEKTHAKFEEIEKEVLKIAENAAKKLASLKETGLWKLSVKDSSDRFDAADLPVIDLDGYQKVLGKNHDTPEPSPLPEPSSGHMTCSKIVLSKMLSSTSPEPSKTDETRNTEPTTDAEFEKVFPASLESDSSTGTIYSDDERDIPQ